MPTCDAISCCARQWYRSAADCSTFGLYIFSACANQFVVSIRRQICTRTTQNMNKHKCCNAQWCESTDNNYKMKEDKQRMKAVSLWLVVVCRLISKHEFRISRCYFWPFTVSELFQHPFPLINLSTTNISASYEWPNCRSRKFIDSIRLDRKRGRGGERQREREYLNALCNQQPNEQAHRTHAPHINHIGLSMNLLYIIIRTTVHTKRCFFFKREGEIIVFFFFSISFNCLFIFDNVCVLCTSSTRYYS